MLRMARGVEPILGRVRGGVMALRHNYQRGHVISIPFPYSDSQKRKERPAIVLSTQPYHDNWDELLVVAVTSRPPRKSRTSDYQLQDLQMAGLQVPSWVRSHLTTVHYGQ